MIIYFEGIVIVKKYCQYEYYEKSYNIISSNVYSCVMIII